MTVIFVDTGAFLARYVANDQHHQLAVALWDRLRRTGSRLFTSNFVLDELFTLLGRRVGYSFAADRAQGIYASKRLSIMRPNLDEELEALKLFEKYADQKVSFTDCVSFALMSRARIPTVFGFDRHFRLAGFELLS